MSRTAVIWSSIGVITVVALIVGTITTMIVALDEGCTVNGYTLYGDLETSRAFGAMTEGVSVSYSEDIAAGIKESNQNDAIKAVVVEIDSYGGQPVAGEEIANALLRSEKPVVALIRSAGASAAYWGATGADTIFASANSDVGGIGVILPLTNEVVKDEQEGIRNFSISSAPFKDLGSPYHDMTDEEENILQGQVDKVHNNFVDAVSQNRQIPREEIEKLATGNSILGSEALEKKLIDHLGDQNAVEDYLRELLGEDPHICWQGGEEEIW